MIDNQYVKLPYIKKLTNFWRETTLDGITKPYTRAYTDYAQKISQRRQRMLLSNVNASLAGKTQKFMSGSLASKTPLGLYAGFGIKSAGVALGVGVGIYALSKSILSTLRWQQPVERQQIGVGYGPGFISWSKKQGMPPNHLGTDNLMNSLHRNRHSSII